MFNRDKSEKLYLKTLKKGNAQKQYELARKFVESENRENFTRACALYEAAANSGHKDAQFELGFIYYDGTHCEYDWAKAEELFEKAAENGAGQAYFYLGEIYFYGFYGSDKDEKKSAENYLKAYDFCNEEQKAEVERKLGGYYYCLDDEENALHWARRCAKRGGGDALASYGAMLADFKRYDEAFGILTRAAELGEDYSVYILGECYFYGRGVSKDLKKAEELWQKAAQNGIEDAAEDLKKHFGKG